MTSELRISDTVVASDLRVESTILLGDKSWKRNYEIWRHAQNLLGTLAPKEQDCAAAMFQLNRAVDFRDRLLARIYSFKHIPGSQRFRNQHEVMCKLGLILPLMKTKLDVVRNELMHKPEAAPPSIQVCRELMEFTWYYLRSTDRLCFERPVDVVSYWSAGSDYPEGSLNWEVNTHPWKFKASGWIPQQLIEPNGEGTLTLQLCNAPENGRDGSAVWLRDAELIGPFHQIERMIDLYFSLTHGEAD